MIEMLAIGKVNLRTGQPVPPVFESLIEAARRRDPLLPYMQSIIEGFGFDSFEYGISRTEHADKNAANYCYSTLPEWIAHYAKKGYIEIDPRLFLTCTSAVPLVWDQSTIRTFGPTVMTFLDDALAHGLASGVSFMWHGPYETGVIVTLNSHVKVNDEIRKKTIARNLADIVMFGHYFHEIFVVPALPFALQPLHSLPDITERERECLGFAARGMTTNDISLKLDIAPRTVKFHFARVFDKWGVANRQEAVARAVQFGLVRPR